MKNQEKIALISVYNKEGLEQLVRTLNKYRYKMIASSGTAKKIKKMGYEATEISKYTGFPESPNGLVKTLHPKIHGGLLLNPKNHEHKRYMEETGIKAIEIIIINLYPFEEVIKRGKTTIKEAAENIDIGGPAMIRAAAKGALLNGRPAIIINPNQYPMIISELERNNGEIKKETTIRLAISAFKRTMRYDKTIVNYLKKIFGDNDG